MLIQQLKSSRKHFKIFNKVIKHQRIRLLTDWLWKESEIHCNGPEYRFCMLDLWHSILIRWFTLQDNQFLSPICTLGQDYLLSGMFWYLQNDLPRLRKNLAWIKGYVIRALALTAECDPSSFFSEYIWYEIFRLTIGDYIPEKKGEDTANWTWGPKYRLVHLLRVHKISR